MLCLGDFLTCNTHTVPNIESVGSISQLWGTVGRQNLVYVFIIHSYTQIVNNVTLECFCYGVGKDLII